MAKRHWLDPLARQVLRATGQIPAPSRQPPRVADNRDIVVRTHLQQDRHKGHDQSAPCTFTNRL